MQWSEVRSLFPDSFVLVEDQKSHVENGELHVEEVAVIRPLADGKEAMDELMKAHQSIAMPIRSKPAYRGIVQ